MKNSQRYLLRKSSAYGLTGVVLVGGLLLGSNVSADEVPSSNNSEPTNSVPVATAPVEADTTNTVVAPQTNQTTFEMASSETNTTTSETATATNAPSVTETTPVETPVVATQDTKVVTTEVVKEPAQIPAPEVKEVAPVVETKPEVDKTVNINNATPAEPKVAPVTQTDIKVVENNNQPTLENPNQEIKGQSSTGSIEASVTAKSSTTTTENTTVTHEPMDLMIILDQSGSAGGLFTEFQAAAIDLIKRGLSDKDKIMVATYGSNNEKTYFGWSPEVSKNETHAVTRLLSKDEAITYISSLNKSDNFDPRPYMSTVGYATKKGGYEDIYEAQPNKNGRVSVIQFTDEWTKGEEIDTSFAAWAKANAKTFMSVVSGVPGGFNKSVVSMEKAGHPNIYVTKELAGNSKENKQMVYDDVVKTFQNTAITKVEKVTTTEKQDVEFFVIADPGINISSIVLTKPDGKTENLKVEGGKAMFKQADATDGTYKVKVDFTGVGNVAVSGKVDGKEVVNRKESITGQSTVTAKVVDEFGKALATYPIITATKGTDYEIKTPIVKGGYTISRKSGSPKGKVGDKSSEVVYEVKPNAGSVTVHFVDESGKELQAPTKVGEDMGSAWKATAPTEINKNGVVYSLVSKPKEETGTIDRNSKELTYTYAPKKYTQTVNLRVVNALDGSELLNSTPVAKGWRGESYKVNAPTMSKDWVVSLENGNLQGTFNDKDNTITFKASQIGGKVSVKFVDSTGKELQPGRTVTAENAKIGDKWSVGDFPTEITTDGKKYVLVSKPNAVEGTTNKDNILLTFTYVRESAGEVVAKFVGTGGIKLAEDVLVSKDGFTSDTWKMTDFPKELVVDGKKWLLSAVPVDMDGTLDRNNVTLTFEYARERAGKVIAKYINAEGQSVAPDKIISIGGFTGEVWKANQAPEKRTYNGKVYVLSASPEKTEGLLTTTDTTLTYKYVREPAGKVIAKFINAEGKEVAKELVISKGGFTGDEWSMTEKAPSKIEFEGKVYVLKKSPESTKGILEIEDKVITFEYVREPAGKVIMKFVDSEGKEIAKEIVVSEGGFTGDSWIANGFPKEIIFNGEVYLLEVIPGNLDGVLGAEDVVLEFVYKKVIPQPSIAQQETPKPISNPKQGAAKVLPNTGADTNIAMTTFGVLTGIFSLGLTHRRKK